MVDQTAAFIAQIIAGVAGGFLSSWMAFNASGEEFNGRKHGNALITGVLTGLALAIAGVVIDVSQMSVPQFGVLVLTTFLGAAGVDRLRSSGGDMAANNAKESKTVTTTK